MKWGCTTETISDIYVGEIVIPPRIEEHFRIRARFVIERARELARGEFAWKVAEQGTDLKPRSAPNNLGDDEIIFRMEPTTKKEWYGDYYSDGIVVEV